MTAHFKSINREVWKVTKTKFEVANLEAPTPVEEKKLQCNDIAISALHEALYDKTFEQVKNIEIAHDAWAKLEETYESTEGTMSVLKPGRTLSRRVNLCCVFPTLDGDAKRIHGGLSWFGQKKALRPARKGEYCISLHLSDCVGVISHERGSQS
jgi:hypothetical protein